MFGFGKQKKEAYQDPQQEEYFYDEYDAEGYEDDYGYETYSEEGYDRGERRARTRNDAEFDEGAAPSREDLRVPTESPLQQEVDRLEETVAQLKHQLEVKQTELTTMATTLTEKDQLLQDQQADKEQQLQNLKAEKEQQIQNLQAGNEQQIQNLQTEKDKQIQLLMDQLDQSTKQLNQTEQTQAEALAAAQKEIKELKQAQEANEAMKDELAGILVQSKKQERQILERAEYEAKGIRNQAQQDADQMLHDSALELRVMKQEIKNYRKRLRTVQDETAQFFAKLLANSDNLLDEE
ncbi:hypothetical protein JZO70_04435 [Enterococcus sp. 669A]|uniref:Cell division initiation protein n=1 Tax=Candidatus Enterococcus moelleringii TaxID=2815325 RepID=A0ABS3L712_9ENTE|nr:hypothetical protein [Enterococcus sp. 669A]MBO1305393.1 hypothetical protein [Enterococcus sp. 669A]